MNERELTVHYQFNRETEVPSIKLQGKWLEKYGFKIGDKLNVYSNDGVILVMLKKMEDSKKTTVQSISINR